MRRGLVGVWSFVGASSLWLTLTAPLLGQSQERLEGYAEWRRRDVLIVEGQRLRAAPRTRFIGGARDLGSIPLGHEVKVVGRRLPDGAVLADQVESRPNGNALFEGELRQAFDQTEERFRQEGRMFEEDDQGRVRDFGRLIERGPQVARVRGITSHLVPPYLNPDDFRVYVVENKEWNAIAAPNGSIYVFSGLLEDMDDDELAIVLGHELAHATHEHSRKGLKKRMLVQLGTLAAVSAAEGIDSKSKRLLTQMGTVLISSAWTSGYGRGYEDQADRVGLRYAYEGRYDVERGPRLWDRFARKYGNSNKVVNFFFSDHSVAQARARNLERELDLNYRN